MHLNANKFRLSLIKGMPTFAEEGGSRLPIRQANIKLTFAIIYRRIAGIGAQNADRGRHHDKISHYG